MSATLCVLWTITPLVAPQPHINCNRCGGIRPYKSSGKFRVNANGKRIDAWLIYRCDQCDNSWNFAIFERRNRRDIDPALLQALQTNDPATARRYAFDVPALRRAATHVAEFPDVAVGKARVDERCVEPPAEWTALRISLAIAQPVALRLDRLLANELGISRSRLAGWARDGLVALAPGGAEMMRRPCRDATSIEVRLGGVVEHAVILRAASG